MRARERARLPAAASSQRLRADAPELPFDFVCGFAGYLGFELKAECGGRVPHTSPLPDAALLLCDRLIAFDHRERRIHLLALGRRRRRRDADAWLAATEQRLRALAREPPPLPPAPAAPGALRFELHDPPEAYLDNIAACRREIFEGESYEICLTTELRSDGHARPARRLSRAARAQPGAVRRAAAAGRAVRAQLLARALPARRPRRASSSRGR